MSVRWDEMSNDHLIKIEEIFSLYDQAFPIEVREPHSIFFESLKYANKRKPNNFRFLAGFEGEQLVSFATGHYLADVNVGFIVYIVTNPLMRRKGLGAKTLMKIEELLNNDAISAGNESLSALILETEKYEEAQNETEREESIKRTRFFERNQFTYLKGINYLQPPLHKGDSRVPLNLFVKDFKEAERSYEEIRSFIQSMYKEKYYLVNKIELKVLNHCLKEMEMEQLSLVTHDTFTQKGVNSLNEDATVINPATGIYGVLDGVSSLVPYLSDNKETGGFIASNTVRSYFESLTNIENLKDHTEIANEILRGQMVEAKIDLDKKEELWGTALAIVRLEEDGVEFIQTGDCMILAVYEDKEVRPLTRLQVSNLEAPAFTKWQEGISRGLRRQKELLQSVINILKGNRYQSNVSGGYGVLNGEFDASRFMEYGKINLIGLKHLILLTDGLFWPTNLVPDQQSYWSFISEKILKVGIKQYTQDLIEIEENDPECITHIRFKKSDDKTGIVINF